MFIILRALAKMTTQLKTLEIISVRFNTTYSIGLSRVKQFQYY